jgi:hypothetical protein
LPKQKIYLFLTDTELQSCFVQVTGSFLQLDDITPTQNGWMASISQVWEFENPPNYSLFLGNVELLDNNNEIVSSLCVVFNTFETDYFRVIQPKNNKFRLESHQILDVVFYSFDWDDEWICTTDAGEFRLEAIDQRIRIVGKFSGTQIPSFNGHYPVQEYSYRFKLDTPSVELLQDLPKGRYDGGNVSFFKTNGDLQKANLQIVLNWRENKPLVYKTLLLPKKVQKPPKQAMYSVVALKKMICEEIDARCNVIFTKCR